MKFILLAVMLTIIGCASEPRYVTHEFEDEDLEALLCHSANDRKACNAMNKRPKQ